MGNRAVISFDENDNAIGVYLHWNGGPESVLAFLDAAKELGIRGGEDRPYFFARFCQIIGNFFGGTTSVGIGPVKSLDTDNGNNGWYIIDNKLDIVKRLNTDGTVKAVADLKAGATSHGGLEYYEGVKDEVLKANSAIFKKG